MYLRPLADDNCEAFAAAVSLAADDAERFHFTCRALQFPEWTERRNNVVNKNWKMFLFEEHPQTWAVQGRHEAERSLF